MKNKKILAIFIIIIVLVLAVPAYAQTGAIMTINGYVLTVEDKDGKTWTVNVTDLTKLVRKFGGASKLSEFRVGDTVKIKGAISEDGASISAANIKDVSIQKKKATFEGTIKSIDHIASSFVLTTSKRGEQKVVILESTKIVLNGKAITHADLAEGQRVNVKGIWNTSLKIIDAQRIVAKKIKINTAATGISGKVMLGPHCPVIGPEGKGPNREDCADTPFKTNLAVMTKDRSREVARFFSNTQGEFKVVVPPGEYVIEHPLIQIPEDPAPPRCSGKATVKLGKFAEIVVNCDTGIR